MLYWPLLLLLLLAGSQRGAPSSPSASSVNHHPMAGAGGIDDVLPTIALSVAYAALDEVQRHDPGNELLEDSPRVKHTRRSRRRRDVATCAWAQLLRDEELRDHTSRTAKLFREDFRVPYPFFLRLVEVVKRKEWFPTANKDACGRLAHPVEHKVLACLTILGRGNCFGSIYQMSWMSAATAQATFHSFCKHFAREMYDEHIYLPTEDGHVDRVTGTYGRLGFPGALGSTDVTHVAWSRCPYNQARSYTGKEGFPTVAFQVTVDHTGRVLAVTEGFTGSTNDKTIICCDAAVDKIRFDPIYTEKTFDVYTEDGTTRTLKGLYLLVDNGYHKWVTLIEPTKYPLSEGDLAFSKRLESVRKDVECFFGILKGRFRILKLAMTYQKQEYIDNVFFTCCILHNMLHTLDDMAQLEENVNWVGSAGLHNARDHDPRTDMSSVGAKDSEDTPQVEEGHALRKRQLTTSFMYRKKHKKDIVWLSR